MNTNVLRKNLVVGIILLFVGTCIIPAIAQDTEKSSLPASRGDWLYVGGSGTGNYTRIQDAIDNASSGDTVFVYDDSSPYYEHVRVTKAINLIGENVNTTTINDNFSQLTAAISLLTRYITIKGFTIKGEATFCAIELPAGFATIEGNTIISEFGIRGDSSNNNSIFYNNITAYGLPGSLPGHGIDQLRSNNRVEHNSIFASEGFEIGGDNNIINDNLIVQDYLAGGAFSTLYGSPMNVISNNTFRNGGLRLSPGYNYIIVSNNTVNDKTLVFLQNVTNKLIDYDAGQVILVRCKNVTVQNQNYSSYPVFAIQVYDSTNCYITNNTMSHLFPGITIYESNTIMVMDNTLDTSELEIGRLNSDYNTNIIVSRNIFTSDSLAYNSITIENTNDSILSYNDLVNAGIDLYGDCWNCSIKCNNFIEKRGFYIYVPLNSHNTFRYNYWGRLRLFPKFILGIVWEQGDDYYPETRLGFFIDWRPALIPYDIGGK